MNHVQRLQVQSEIMQLPLQEQIALVSRLDWLADGRSDQMPPPEDNLGWFIWLMMAGRGSGKTRAGAEDAWWYGHRNPGCRYAIVAPTSADSRKTCFEGESGLLARCPPELVDNWNRGEQILTMTNGSMFQGYSAEEPDRLRGPQHHRAWCDELAAWRYLDKTLDNLLMGLRLGENPRVVATTTPRPIKRIKEIVSERYNYMPGMPMPKADGTTYLDTVSTYANRDNLPRIFLDTILKRYEGTRLGRQELEAALLTDMPGALWSLTQIEELRTSSPSRGQVLGRSGQVVDLRRIVVAVDPATKSKADSDEWGIVVAGIGTDDRGYVLADLSQGGTPAEIGEIAVRAYDEWGADRLVYEGNQGGDMVLLTITTSARELRRSGRRPVDHVSTQEVWASRGKVTRAEPVSALYEQGMVSHVGAHPTLEDQMGEFTSDFNRDEMGYSPDRVDALVWAFFSLMLEGLSDGSNVMDHYRRGHEEVVRRARRASGVVPVGELVRLVPPPGVSQASGMTGTLYTVGSEGWMEVSPDDAVPLRSAGFAPWTEEMAA